APASTRLDLRDTIRLVQAPCEGITRRLMHLFFPFRAGTRDSQISLSAKVRWLGRCGTSLCRTSVGSTRGLLSTSAIGEDRTRIVASVQVSWQLDAFYRGPNGYMWFRIIRIGIHMLISLTP